MSQVDRSARADFRSRDPALLGARLASQLLAYRCSTVYGPDPALLRELVEAHALPLLAQQHEIRQVIVAAWPATGPSLAHLVAEILRQLELEPAGEPGDLAGLRQALARAHRNSSRPLVLVLHGLDRLLDDDRDRGADRRLLDALAATVELPTHGLQLVMTVHERDLGAFRHLLRGRWRLLANDLRLHGDDRRLPVPLPIAAGTAAAGAAVAGAAVVSRGPLIAALGGLLGLAGVAFGVHQRGAAEAAREQLAACQRVTCPEVQPVASPPPPVPKDIPLPAPDLPAPDPPDPGDSSTGAPEPAPIAPLLAPPKPKTCPAQPGDNPCAACVRKTCCAQLLACKSDKWKQCVLGSKVPSDACPPEAIEKGCRTLALCALEYQCNAVCYNK